MSYFKKLVLVEVQVGSLVFTPQQLKKAKKKEIDLIKLFEDLNKE